MGPYLEFVQLSPTITTIVTDHLGKNTPKTIVVLGAKPNAALPAVPASVVITANNAAELGVLYRERYGSRLIAMTSSRVLRDRVDVQEAFKKSKPDEIVLLGTVIGDATTYVRQHLGLKETAVRVLTEQERNALMLGRFGWRKFLLMFTILRNRGLKHLMGYVLPDLFNKREMSWLNRSTGLNAILYALKEFPEASEVIVAGIGLQEGAHFNGQGAFKSKDAKADRITMKYWHKKFRSNVYTTDEAMHSIGKVSKWNGDVFFSKPSA